MITTWNADNISRTWIKYNFSTYDFVYPLIPLYVIGITSAYIILTDLFNY